VKNKPKQIMKRNSQSNTILIDEIGGGGESIKKKREKTSQLG